MSNSRMSTEFRMMSRQYDGAFDILAKSFPLNMVNIIIREASRTHGEESVLIPTDVEFMPVYAEGDSFFAVRAWHEAAGPDGSIGVLQPFAGHFGMVIDETNAYLYCRSEDEDEVLRLHLLTTAEALGLQGLTRVAKEHSAIASTVDQEALE